MSTVLVVAAHPDDEAIGCGGALRRHVLDGDRVKAIFATSGEAGGHGLENAGETREIEAQRAAEILGITDVEFWHEPDGRLENRPQLVSRLAESIVAADASLIYAPHSEDDHPDHRSVAGIAKAALAQSGCSGTRLMQFEIWSPIQRIDHVVDISEVLEDKLQAIRAYRSQCAVIGFDAAFAGLARYRGEMHSWPGGPYAEVFCEG